MTENVKRLIEAIKTNLRKGNNDKMIARGVWSIECFNSDGELKWSDEFSNLIVDEGLEKFLDDTLLSGTQTATYYIGLTDGTPTVDATDTLASHAGWTEVSDYTEGVRQTFTATRSSQTVSNSASKATFSVNATVTIGGGFLSTASSGTTGTLISAGAFSEGDRSAVSGDTLSVQYSITMSAS